MFTLATVHVIVHVYLLRRPNTDRECMHEVAQHTHTHTLTYALAVGQTGFTMATGEQCSRMQSLADTGVPADSTLHVHTNSHAHLT